MVSEMDWAAYQRHCHSAVRCRFVVFTAGRKRLWHCVVGIERQSECALGVLLLFGGGLIMADQIQKAGVAELLAQQLQLLAGVPPILPLVTVTSLIIFPDGSHQPYSDRRSFPAAIRACCCLNGIVSTVFSGTSFAFMLPVATRPNAIVFASGKLQIKAA